MPSPGGQQGSMSTMTDVAAALGVDAQAQAEEAADEEGDDEGSRLCKSVDDLKLGAVVKLAPDVRLPSGLTVPAGKRQTSLPSRSPPHLSPLVTAPSSFYSHDNSTAPHLSSSAQTVDSPVEHLSPSSAPDHPSPLGSAARQRRKPPAPPVNRATKGRLPFVAGGARRGTETVEEGRFGWQTFA